jgi:hypothetical protein
MRILVATLALVASCLRAEDTSTVNRAWVSEPVSEQYGKFQTVTIYPCPTDKKLLAAYCEREEAWWGHMRVYKQSGDHVEWAATFPEEYIKERGHYVVSSRWTSLPMVENPVLELIESTHMGNGSLWLMELEGREFRLLLHTSVRGRLWCTDPEFGIPPNGEAKFEGSHLNISYPRSSDGTVSVQLDGKLSITDMEGKKLPPCNFYQVCTWSTAKKVFEAQKPRKNKDAEQDASGNRR